MKKKDLWGAIALVICVAAVLIVSLRDKIPTINKEKVVRVYYSGIEANTGKELEVDKFLNYYNKIYDIEESKMGAVTTAPSMIEIQLENSESIRILYQAQERILISYEDDNGPKYYWGKQEQIYNMLRYGEYEIEEMR